MLDATYQSVICYFMVHLLFAPGIFVTSDGQDIGDRNRVGVYVAVASVIVVNLYIMLNTSRWDWLMCLLTGISTLLVFFWTGVWSTNETFAEFFYQAAAQVFGQPSFWAVVFLIVIICLLPRFVLKFLQKVYFPYDVDIIREQVRQGKFKYLDAPEGADHGHGSESTSAASEDFSQKPSKHFQSFDDDQRPLKAPSVAPTTTTHNPRSQNGSDGTDYTRHRYSVPENRDEDMASPLPPHGTPAGRQSVEGRPRPSFDRMRQSMDRIRPSFEQTNDFTSAAMLTRMESSHSFGPTASRRSVFTDTTPHAR